MMMNILLSEEVNNDGLHRMQGEDDCLTRLGNMSCFFHVGCHALPAARLQQEDIPVLADARTVNMACREHVRDGVYDEMIFLAGHDERALIVGCEMPSLEQIAHELDGIIIPSSLVEEGNIIRIIVKTIAMIKEDGNAWETIRHADPHPARIGEDMHIPHLIEAFRMLLMEGMLWFCKPDGIMIPGDDENINMRGYAFQQFCRASKLAAHTLHREFFILFGVNPNPIQEVADDEEVAYPACNRLEALVGIPAFKPGEEPLKDRLEEVDTPILEVADEHGIFFKRAAWKLLAEGNVGVEDAFRVERAIPHDTFNINNVILGEFLGFLPEFLIIILPDTDSNLIMLILCEECDAVLTPVKIADHNDDACLVIPALNDTADWYYALNVRPLEDELAETLIAVCEHADKSGEVTLPDGSLGCFNERVG